MGKWMDKLKANNSVLDSKNDLFTTISTDVNALNETTKSIIHPTVSIFDVPDGLEVSGTVPDTSLKKSGDKSSGTLKIKMREVSDDNSTLPNTTRVRTRSATALCFELLATPLTRTEAVERLVATFRAEVHDAQRERWTMTVLDGSPVADAAPDYLLAETVGLTAWAWDREVRGPKNLGAWFWIETAKEALGRFSRPHVA